MPYDAVLFDWMLTLAHYPSPADHVAAGLALVGRPAVPAVVADLVARLDAARHDPDVIAAAQVEDTSAVRHRAYEDLLHARAGVDRDLSTALYDLLGTPGFHPPYPDSADVLRRLHDAGHRVGVASDIHVDLRVHARAFGFAPYVDAWSLSFEIGVQKPDRAIFEHALAQLGTAPERTLMVGDRASHDGAAAALGLPCLILPAPAEFGPRGLERVLHAAGLR